MPNLPVATSYIILRPFFRPKNPRSDSLKFEDWELDLDHSSFPGSSIGKTQELDVKTHPHLKLNKTMISIPKVEPGDQVYCEYYRNTDVVEILKICKYQGTAMSFMLSKASTAVLATPPYFISLLFL